MLSNDQAHQLEQLAFLDVLEHVVVSIVKLTFLLEIQANLLAVHLRLFAKVLRYVSKMCIAGKLDDLKTQFALAFYIKKQIYINLTKNNKIRFSF